MRVVHRLEYDTERFPFDVIAAEVLGVRSIQTLADEVLREKRRNQPNAELDATDNFVLRSKLTSIGPEHPLRTTYVALVSNVVGPAFGGTISLTRHPTFRVQLAGTNSVSAPHRDADVTRRLDYINIWVPFIDVAGPSTIWIADDYGSQRTEPIDVRYGEILIFDGGLLVHESVTNTTSTSRVGFDARFVPRTEEGAQRAALIVADRRPEDLVLAPEGSVPVGRGGY